MVFCDSIDFFPRFGVFPRISLNRVACGGLRVARCALRVGGCGDAVTLHLRLTRISQRATRNADRAFLSNLNAHASGCAFNNFAGRIQIVGIEVDHFLVGNRFDLFTGYFSNPIPLGITRTFSNFSCLF